MTENTHGPLKRDSWGRYAAGSDRARQSPPDCASPQPCRSENSNFRADRSASDCSNVGYVGSASTRPLESGYAQKASLLQTLTCGYEGAHPFRSVTSGRHGNSRRRRQIPRKIPKIFAPPGRLRDFCLLVSPARTVGSLPPGPFSAPPSPGGAAPKVRGHELPRGRPCSLGQHPHTLEADITGTGSGPVAFPRSDLQECLLRAGDAPFPRPGLRHDGPARPRCWRRPASPWRAVLRGRARLHDWRAAARRRRRAGERRLALVTVRAAERGADRADGSVRLVQDLGGRRNAAPPAPALSPPLPAAPTPIQRGRGRPPGSPTKKAASIRPAGPDPH